MRKKRMKTTSDRKIFSLFFLIFVVSSFFLTGCSIYNADVPEYTTGSERNHSFRAQSFQSQHESTNPEKEKIEQLVDEKFPQIMDQGQQYKAEVENFQKEVTDNLEKIK